MTRLRRTLAAGALGWLLLLGAPAPAWGHASLVSSQPEGGSALDEAPEQVLITFTEPPDPALTSVTVVGSAGTYEDSPPRLAGGGDVTVVVDLEELPQGSFTVSWRTVSRVDGHSSAGAFAFGVGEPPEDISAESVEDTGARPAASIARWLSYLGLSALVGVSWMVLLAFRKDSPLLAKAARLGAVAAAAGIAGLGFTQFDEAQVPFGVFAGSSAGRAMMWRLAPLAVAGLGLALSKSTRVRYRIALAGGLLAMLSHSAAGHAAVPPNAVPKVLVHWIHFAAVGVWIGGLGALILGIGALDPDDRFRVAKRFSTVAGFALLAVAATGILRAVNEVRGWEPLFDTSYGKLVIAKSVLIVALGALGAVNRFRMVPHAASTPSGLQKAGRLEIGVAVVTMAVAGVLSTSVPPVSIVDSADNSPVVVSGSNFARTAQATLAVDPGTGGPNNFEVALTEPGSDEPFTAAETVALRFSALSNAVVGDSTLELEESGAGLFQATGSNLSVDGRWQVTVEVGLAGDSLEIPLELSTKAPGYRTDTSRVEGLPTIHQIYDPEGRQLQVYADPDRPGRSELHLTLFGADGTELEASGVLAIAARGNEPSSTLATRRFGPGHFVAGIELEDGKYTLDVTFETPDGASLRFPLTFEITA